MINTEHYTDNNEADTPDAAPFVFSSHLQTIPQANASEQSLFLAARQTLFSELGRAEAPVTARRVAALLLSHDGKEYLGHNDESNGPPFFHAERQALTAAGDIADKSISRVIMAGSGQPKMKWIAPCYNCYSALDPHLSDTAQITLFQPNMFDTAVTLNAAEFRRGYETKPLLRIIGGSSLQVTRNEIHTKTLLTPEDTTLMLSLRKLALARRAGLYLTGSASGRGGISQEIQQKRGQKYEDLDIIVVSPEQTKAVASDFKRIIVDRYGRRLQQRVAGNGHDMPTIIPYGSFSKQKTTVDLTIAKTLKYGMFDPVSYRKGWYIKVA
jgi:cytidine deaminase